MAKQKQSCTWIGIGSDVTEGTDIYHKIIEADNLLANKYGTEDNFIIGRRPHLNLYDLSVPSNSIELIVGKMKLISETQKRFTVKARGVSYFHFGIVFLVIKKSKVLTKLHKKAIGEVSGLRGGCIDEDYLALNGEYTKKQKKLLIEHGNPYVLDQFFPHITIGYVKNKREKLGDIRKELDKLIPKSEIQINNIHIVSGDGKEKKTIKRFNLTD